jgi:hypothetical protein
MKLSQPRRPSATSGVKTNDEGVVGAGEFAVVGVQST